MPIAAKIPVLDLTGKATRILRKMPLFEFDGGVYANALSEIASKNQSVAENLMSMGLRRGWITPQTIKSLDEYGAVFTPQGAFKEECLEDVFATVHEAEISPKDMTAWEYLVNPKVWKPPILNVFGRGSVEKVADRATMYERVYKNVQYFKGRRVLTSVEKPSNTFLSFKASVDEETAKGREDVKNFFARLGTTTY